MLTINNMLLAQRDNTSRNAIYIVYSILSKTTCVAIIHPLASKHVQLEVDAANI